VTHKNITKFMQQTVTKL